MAKSTAQKTKATTAKRGNTESTPKKGAKSANGAKSATSAKSAPKATRPAPAKTQGERKPAAGIAPGEKGPKKVAKPLKSQGDKIEDPSRSKPMSMRDLLEARQRSRQGPTWPDADPHNHRARETLEPSSAEKSSEKAHAAEAKNMDPTERDRRSKHEPRGVR